MFNTQSAVMLGPGPKIRNEGFGVKLCFALFTPYAFVVSRSEAKKENKDKNRETKIRFKIFSFLTQSYGPNIHKIPNIGART